MANETQGWSSVERIPEEAAYQSLSSLAVATFGLGILSAGAWIMPLFWGIPVLAIFLGIIAWRRIATSEGTLSGSRLLMIGLCLALLSGVGAPVRYWSYRWGVVEEAKQVADQWFTYLAADQPERAYQMTVPVAARRPLDDADPWQWYQADESLAQELRGFVDDPMIRLLLQLGTEAEVRFYAVEATDFGSIPEQILLTYAITLRDQPEPRTFFATVGLVRFPDSQTGRGYWKIEVARGGVIPHSVQNLD